MIKTIFILFVLSFITHSFLVPWSFSSFVCVRHHCWRPRYLALLPPLLLSLSFPLYFDTSTTSQSCDATLPLHSCFPSLQFVAIAIIYGTERNLQIWTFKSVSKSFSWRKMRPTTTVSFLEVADGDVTTNWL